MQTEEMRLDGNAAAGMLSELFVNDVTMATAVCRGCGSVGPIGRMLEYGHGMGIVLRCAACESVMLRVVRTPRALFVDASGAAVLSIPIETPVV
jgi:hypothetical protein